MLFNKSLKVSSKNLICYFHSSGYSIWLWSGNQWQHSSVILHWMKDWIVEGSDYRKFLIMSTEFDKNISDWSYDCTDCKTGIDFFMRLVKWPKIAVKKCQNLIFKVNFQRQKSSKSLWKKKIVEEYQSRGTFFVFSNFV